MHRARTHAHTHTHTHTTHTLSAHAHRDTHMRVCTPHHSNMGKNKVCHICRALDGVVSLVPITGFTPHWLRVSSEVGGSGNASEHACLISVCLQSNCLKLTVKLCFIGKNATQWTVLQSWMMPQCWNSGQAASRLGSDSQVRTDGINIDKLNFSHRGKSRQSVCFTMFCQVY